MNAPNTLQEAIVYFSDPDRAFEYAKKFRWPDGNVVCPRCGKAKHSFIKTRRVWFCYECKKQFSLKLGTVFEDSALGLDKWMTGFWMLVNCKNGVSSMEIHRALGITQKAAWFMLQRLRLAIQDDFFGRSSEAGGEVEVDETFIGGKARNMHRATQGRITGTGTKDKTVVVGFMERGERFAPGCTESQDARIARRSSQACRSWRGTLHRCAVSYVGLETDYAHQVVDHAVQYVDGRVHTNGLENFWSLLKRGIYGTYVRVEPFHLFRYLDEQAFRFNNRKNMNDDQRFTLAMSQIGGKRLTYSQLTGRTIAAPRCDKGVGNASPF